MREEIRSILMGMNIQEDIKRDIITKIENSLLNKDYIYISPVNGNSMFIKKKFIVGFYAHEDYT